MQLKMPGPCFAQEAKLATKSSFVTVQLLQQQQQQTEELSTASDLFKSPQPFMKMYYAIVFLSKKWAPEFERV